MTQPARAGAPARRRGGQRLHGRGPRRQGAWRPLPTPHLRLAVDTAEPQGEVHGEAQRLSSPAAHVGFGLEKRGVTLRGHFQEAVWQ